MLHALNILPVFGACDFSIFARPAYVVLLAPIVRRRFAANVAHYAEYKMCTLDLCEKIPLMAHTSARHTHLVYASSSILARLTQALILINVAILSTPAGSTGAPVGPSLNKAMGNMY